jgi:hypothetical protein
MLIIHSTTAAMSWPQKLLMASICRLMKDMRNRFREENLRNRFREENYGIFSIAHGFNRGYKMIFFAMVLTIYTIHFSQ